MASIYALSFIKNPEKFDDESAKIIDYLSKNDFNKTKIYIEKYLEKKKRKLV